MLDKSKLGARYICFQCGTKFYDLNRPTPICPECQADQSDAPVQDIRRMLSSRGKRKPKEEAPPPPPVAKPDEDDDLGSAVEGDEEGEEKVEEGKEDNFLPT